MGFDDGDIASWPPGVRLAGLWRRQGQGTPRAAIAIPVRDEADRLERCLEALSSQRGVARDDFEVILVLNNCRDASLAAARRAAARLPLNLTIHVIELPLALAHVGWARRLAMNEAARRLQQAGRRDGVVLSTDADSMVVEGWLAAVLSAIDAGADAVAGSIEPDPNEALRLNPNAAARLRDDQLYGQALERLATLLDPEPHDPWPRHGYHCGASMAARVSTYVGVGGLPPETVGEDRAFFAAIFRRDGRIRHCPEVRVITSCRLRGRAAGGMADTLRRWSSDGTDEEGIDAAYPAARALWLRARLRELHRRPLAAGALASRIGIAERDLLATVQRSSFGAAYQSLLEQCEALRGRRMTSRHLPRELARARHLIHRLSRAQDRLSGGRDQGGSGRSERT